MNSLPEILSAVGCFTTFLCLWLFLRERGRRRASENQWDTTAARQQRILEASQRSGQALLEGLRQLQNCDTADFAETIVECARMLLTSEQVLLFLAEGDNAELRPVAVRGVAPDHLRNFHLMPGEGVLGRAAQATIGSLAESNTLEHGFLKGPYLTYPLHHRGRASGLLVISQPRAGAYSADALALAELIASQIALVHENHRAVGDLQGLYDQFVQALARAVDIKDHYTHDHSDRTRALVRACAEEIHLPESLIRQTEYGALLHDVGKIGIPDAILCKTDKLTPEEYDIMKAHPQHGHKILYPVPFLRPVAAIVLYHQEWFNGRGYPEGLSGEEIPLGARLVAIIDAWDAMTSDRPYRQAMPRAAAVTELRRQAGTQFDSRLVDAFLRAIEKLEASGVRTVAQSHVAAG